MRKTVQSVLGILWIALAAPLVYAKIQTGKADAVGLIHSHTEYSSTIRKAPRRVIVFEDRFDSFNPDVWRPMVRFGRPNNYEFQMYVNNRSNTYARDGILYIKPTLTSDKYGEYALTSGEFVSLYTNSNGNNCTDPFVSNCVRQGTPDLPLSPIMSARIETINSFCVKYGIVHVRAKLPKGDWLWPAIWLMPKANYYGSWPRSGEFDIMESRGNVDLPSGNVNEFGATLHFGMNSSTDRWRFTHFSKTLENGKTFNDDFHVYGLEWTPDRISFTLDGEILGTVRPDEGGFWKIGQFPEGLENLWEIGGNLKMAPFDNCFYLILNVAVGGNTGYFPDTPNKPWRNADYTATRDFWNARDQWLPTWVGEQAALQVDYVRVWSL